MKKLALLFAAITIPLSTLLFTRPVSAQIDTTRDCDTVAIITCGSLTVSELQADAKKDDVPRVFANFGISQTELNGFVDGVVWKDGRVTLGTRGQGKLVATNAVTAGRWNNPTADMTRIPNTDRAYRMSTSHFVDEGQIAFVKVVNGQFQFAVIKTCGNPVTAKPVVQPQPQPQPQPKPNLTVTKDVSTMPSGPWQQTVTVKPGDHVWYRIIGKNTGNSTLDKVSVQDILPAGITVVETATSITLNGNFIGNGVTAGMALPALSPGQQFVLIFEAATENTENRPVACSTGLINTGIVRTGNVVPDKSDTAVVKVCAVTAPSYTCNFMNLTQLEGRHIRVDATKSASSGVIFQHFLFDFGDNTPVVTSTNGSAEHTYAQDGNYTTRATAVFTVNGQTQSVTSDACVKQVAYGTTPTPPQTPLTTGKLIDTGPGAVIGALASAIAGGTLAYRFVWLRRYN